MSLLGICGGGANYEIELQYDIRRKEKMAKYTLFGVSGVGPEVNTAVKRLRMRELLSELSFQQRLRKSISLGAFIKL